MAVPATVSILAGQNSATFVAMANSTSVSESAIITASLANGISTAFAITVVPSPIFLLQGSQAEVSGLSNGSTITPEITPGGLKGTVVANGAGSVNFTPIEGGNGVYFQNCCANTNQAYYKFAGSVVGNMFSNGQGKISFALMSRYSFTQRQAEAASPRYAFDARDGDNNHLFGFSTQIASGRLTFHYAAAGLASSYFVPAGTEDVLFGKGVMMQVTITWNGTGTSLYLNNTLVQSVPYTKHTANWNGASNFDLGAYEYQAMGGYNASDDIISEFTLGTAASTTQQIASKPASPPVISAVSATSVTPSGATIIWTTNEGANSQLAYGIVSSLESVSMLNAALVTSHSVALTGLQPATTYHFQAESVDGDGNEATSGDFTFTTESVQAAPQILFQLHANGSEVSGVTNGSTVTPSAAPQGFTGKVIVNDSGSVDFAPDQTGNGVYFLNCCTNTGNAYFKFTGASIGNIFGINQGQISFNLTSRHSFAERQTSAPSPRYAFDVRDGSGNHVFGFLTQIVANSAGTYLEFNYVAAGYGGYYYVPAGTEDSLFGEGVSLKVTITWDGAASNLYLNDALVKSTPETQPTPTWNATSVFDLGAYEYQTFGGYNVSDDVIADVTVSHP